MTAMTRIELHNEYRQAMHARQAANMEDLREDARGKADDAYSEYLYWRDEHPTDGEAIPMMAAHASVWAEEEAFYWYADTAAAEHAAAYAEHAANPNKAEVLLDHHCSDEEPRSLRRVRR